MGQIGVDVRVVAPLGAAAADLARLGDADFNVVLYPEVGALAASWLQRSFGQPFTKTVPIGSGATRDFVREVCALAGLDADAALTGLQTRADWYAGSVDSTYLTGKRVFIFGDATHAIAAARVASQEMGFQVVGLGTYSREFARDLREAAKLYGVDALISDDYLEVEARVAELQPELVLGTQMERHIAKRLGVPCAVISAPVHVQDFPARYSPQMGFEGANVLFDTWVHPLMMGLEEQPGRHVPRRLRIPRGRGAVAPGRQSEWQRAASVRPCRRAAGGGGTARDAGDCRRHGAAPGCDGGSRRRAADRRRALGARRRKGTPQNPVLRPRQGHAATPSATRRTVAWGLITIETLYDAKAHFSR